jgi:phthalate 4,5-dioxygenase
MAGYAAPTTVGCTILTGECSISLLKYLRRRNVGSARAYPIHKAVGVFWIYLGEGQPPLFPEYPALQGSDEYRYTCRWFGDCNWLQASEGNIDPVHISYLHQREWTDAAMEARWGVFAINSRAEVSVADTRFGVQLFTSRAIANSDSKSIRITNFVMPNACAVGGFESNLGPGGTTMLWDVPIDNEHHWRWEFIFHRTSALSTRSTDLKRLMATGCGGSRRITILRIAVR